ncbi:protein kinase [Streptomyces sp. NPDC046859]|uniref:serine/threonine-protein kinase n=1 Tax=Streptomyces sp. NPDC046859 TaxID=3155734 RepID=UPI0033C6CDF6
MSSGESGQTEGPGRMLAGRYRVVAQLGRGGMGVVWRAVDEVLGREVAVKELRTYSDAAGPELADLRLRMRREARAAARIRHSGVVAVHDIAEVDGRPLIVMELVDGPSLEAVLRERGTLDPYEAAGIGAKVMDALAAAHRAGVLHRDVKPGNILLETSGRVVLTDFGIATMDDPGDGSATQLTRTGQLVGSLDYLAPERAQGAAPGPSSDVWALGATLYAAVEGSAPFRRTSTFSTLTAIVGEPLPAPRRAGPLTPVLERLLDKRSESRPEAEEARDLLRAVADSGTDSPTTALRGPSPSGTGPARERTVADVSGAGPGVPASNPPGAPGFGPAARGPDGPTTPGTPVAQAFAPAGQPYPGPPPHDPGATGPVAGSSGTRPRRRGRALLAAAAVAVVLAASGITAALLNHHDDRAPAAAGGTASPTATGPAVRANGSPEADRAGDSGLTERDASTSPATTGDPSRPADRDPAERPGSASPTGTAGGGAPGTGGGDGGSKPGDTPTTPAAACRPIGGGRYNCEVWKTADSYTASGARAGVLNAGTNYFYCQQNLGRRETSGRWTNVWWAKTDDDSGNTGVFVSDVYIKGGDNDAPVPGLPVC